MKTKGMVAPDDGAAEQFEDVRSIDNPGVFKSIYRIVCQMLRAQCGML